MHNRKVELAKLLYFPLGIFSRITISILTNTTFSVLQSINTTSNETQALTLSPTRELAEQTQKVLLALGDFMNVQCHACIGGKSIG